LSPGENFKKKGRRWHKSGRTEQSGYQFKKYLTCKQHRKHLYRKTSRKRNRSFILQALKNNKRYQENPQLYKHDELKKEITKTNKKQYKIEINEHIFGYIKKTMGL
jgi:ribosomal protein S1